MLFYVVLDNLTLLLRFIVANLDSLLNAMLLWYITALFTLDNFGSVLYDIRARLDGNLVTDRFWSIMADLLINSLGLCFGDLFALVLDNVLALDIGHLAAFLLRLSVAILILDKILDNSVDILALLFGNRLAFLFGDFLALILGVRVEFVTSADFLLHSNADLILLDLAFFNDDDLIDGLDGQVAFLELYVIAFLTGGVVADLTGHIIADGVSYNEGVGFLDGFADLFKFLFAFFNEVGLTNVLSVWLLDCLVNSFANVLVNGLAVRLEFFLADVNVLDPAFFLLLDRWDSYQLSLANVLGDILALVLQNILALILGDFFGHGSVFDIAFLVRAILLLNILVFGNIDCGADRNFIRVDEIRDFFGLWDVL